MDLTEHLDAACTPERLFALVEDLRAYPGWLSIVPRAEPDPTGEGGDEVGAWLVELRGRIGPLARSKRLRMVRTVHRVPTAVRFERRELDGRQHSPWVLDAEVQPTETGSRLTMRLRYGGTFGSGLLERMLREEIERSRPRLRELAESP